MMNKSYLRISINHNAGKDSSLLRDFFSHLILCAFIILVFLPFNSVQAQQLVAKIDVFANDSIPRSSPVLELGKDYEIICEGTFTFWKNINGDSVGLVDAAYFVEIPPGEFGLSGLPTTISNGFLINGMPIVSRVRPQGYNPSHRYVVPWKGLGASVSLFIEDKPVFSIDRHSDNSGMISVWIYNVSPEIIISHDTLIDFGEVELGQRKDTTITISNGGYGPLAVHEIKIFGDDPSDFSVISAPFSLLPGEQKDIALRFAPHSIFRKDAILRIVNNDGDSPEIQVPLTGIGITTLTAGFESGYHGASNKKLTIPVTIFENREGSNTTSFSFLVRYNKAVLLPVAIRKENTLSHSFNLASSITEPGVIYVQASNGNPLEGTGNLVDIDFIVVFSDSLYSSLIIDSLIFNNGNPRARMINGSFSVDTVCDHYRKLVVPENKAILFQNAPNPFNPVTKISFFLPSEQNARLDVYNDVGQLIATPLNRILRKGIHVFEFDGSDLPTGAYYYRLETSGETISKRMILMR